MPRFLPWVNTMTKAATDTNRQEDSVPISKIHLKKIEYKMDDRLEKTIECKVTQSTNRKVTKGFTERRAKYDGVPDAFGVNKDLEGIKANIGLTLVQREDIWHPYYEQKLEEESLTQKLRKNIEQKKLLMGGGGQQIEALEAQLQQMEREEEEHANQPTQRPKRAFDINAIQKNLA